jgi:hypothetical protein
VIRRMNILEAKNERTVHEHLQTQGIIGGRIENHAGITEIKETAIVASKYYS